MHSGSWDGPDDEPVDSVLDSFSYAAAPDHRVDESDEWSRDSAPSDDEEPTAPIVLSVTASNPAGTISATATISGWLQHVGLEPEVVAMTEFDLAREILATATLASMKGQAGQRNMVEEMMVRQGLDQGAARDYVDQYMNLPTTAHAEAAEAEARSRYLRGEY